MLFRSLLAVRCERRAWQRPLDRRGPGARHDSTTRNPAIDFLNYKHPVAKTADFGGVAAWTDNRYKLLLSDRATANPAKKTGKRTSADVVNLFDLIADPKEERNIAEQHPEIVRRMTAELHAWQRSVERSLSGADY